MLGWIFFAASAYAAFIFSNWFAIGNAILNFWSLGIMHNFGMSRPVQSRIALDYGKRDHLSDWPSTLRSIIFLRKRLPLVLIKNK
jgi:hypothetical protein